MPVVRHVARTLIVFTACTLLAACGDEDKKPATSGGTAATPAPAPSTPTTPPSDTNDAPVITGTPVMSVPAEKPYAFQPSASDPDGDTLTFSIANKPSWASFDRSTGTLSGVPAVAAVGTYSNIRITVSDGSSTTSLPAFSVTVQAAPLGSATLSWRPPSLNEDGSPVSNLGGYVVRYGTEPSALGSQVRITDPMMTTAVIEQLTSATWYFTVSAMTADGVESDPSAAVSKTIG